MSLKVELIFIIVRIKYIKLVIFFMKKIFLVLLSSVIFILLQISQTYAATITVTSNANSGAGTLRQALLDATTGDTIDFNLSGGSEVITVSSALSIPWGKTITIDGDNTAGSGTNITIQVTTPGTSAYEAITISNGTGKTTTLKNLTIRGGN